MGDVLLSVSNSHVFYQGRDPVPARDLHKPFFWAFPPSGGDAKSLRRRALEAVAQAQKAQEQAEGHGQGSMGGRDTDPLAGVVELGPVEEVESFWTSDTRQAFRVFTRHPGLVPSVSDAFFDRMGAFTAEHDVPYQQRLAVDLAAQGHWPFNTGGDKTTLNVSVFDIETTQYGNVGVKDSDDLPIDVIGWADFPFTYESNVDLETERFDLDVLDAPQDWMDREVVQEVARNEEEEIELLLKFIDKMRSTDVVSGHNIYGFDNLKIHDRVRHFLDKGRKRRNLSPREQESFTRFLDTWSTKDKSYQFGRPDDVAFLHPTGLDTLLAARRFYFYLDDFTLKSLAPFLGIDIDGRQHLIAQELDVNKPETLRYHIHDIQEQLGLSMHLMLQALPLSFSTGMPFEQLLLGMNTKMWDHIGLIRSAYRKRLMPATCRAQAVARAVQNLAGPAPTKEQIAKRVRGMPSEERGRQRDLLRVAKYGEEMPEWVEYPHLVASTGEAAEPTGYSIPGGMTLHPQKMKSQFIPWWHVVAADVGAMYPTILKALNVGADTVRIARKGEEPDAWVWLYRVSPRLLDDGEFVVRKPGKEEEYADRGYMVGIKKREEPGVVNLGMSAILGMIAKVKAELAQAKEEGAEAEHVKRLQLNYQSLKAARNAGTHGILVAVNVSCRQFHVLAGAHITTEGQRILHESLRELEREKIRVVYGDSITGDRCVVVRDPLKRVHVVPVERLFERVKGDWHPWHGKDAILVDGWEALSMDAGTGESGWRLIRRIIRHETDKPVVRIRQKDGETVCTTDHSIMVKDEGRIVKARPEEALDRPLVRAKVPRNAVLDEIDLLEWVGPDAIPLEESIPFNRLFKRPRKTSWFRYDDDWMWFNHHTRPDLGTLRVRRRLKVGTPECSALCRLMGAYVAEGSVNWSHKRRGASIATSDREWLEEIKNDYDMLFEGITSSIISSYKKIQRTVALKGGGSTTYDDNTQKIQMTNLLSAVFFWSLGGRGSAGKKVPTFIFNLPEQHQREFLDAAVKGDGSHKFGRRYSEEFQKEHFNYTTKSLELASGLCTLLGQLNIDYGVRRRRDKGTYTIVTRMKRKDALHAAHEPIEHDGPVYDLEVEDHHTFVDALGTILLHNTDGIYLACGKNGANIPVVADLFDAKDQADPSYWLTHPETAAAAVESLNKRFRRELDYEEFELEPEVHDSMVFVVHKNYLIFDAKSGKFVMETKGNNFKGSDKPNLARTQLGIIMERAMRENLVWEDEDKARESLKASIKRAATKVIQELRISTVDPQELTMIQNVRPARRYKPNPDGSPSTFAKRAEALSRLLEQSGLEPIRAARKLHFVVANRPLPGLEGLAKRKPGLKPIEYMWPVVVLEDKQWKDQGYRVDMEWYKEMVANYIKGAFGFDDLSTVEQRGLDAWL